MLGGRHPVGVDRLDVTRICLAAPADQETLGNRARLVDLGLWHRRAAAAPRRLGHERQRHHGGSREVFTGLLVADIDQLLEPPFGREHHERRLQVDSGAARAHRQRVRLGRR